MKFQAALALAGLSLMTPVVHGDVTVFEDFDAWSQAMGDVSTITFTEHPHATWVDDEYSDLGVQFGGDGNIIYCCDNITYPQDGAGLSGNALIQLSFDSPISGIAMHFPGSVDIELYLEGSLVYDSPHLGGSGYGFFAGLVSTVLFDEAHIHDTDNAVALDNLYFGPPIPAPAALAVFVVATCATRRRR